MPAACPAQRPLSTAAHFPAGLRLFAGEPAAELPGDPGGWPSPHPWTLFGPPPSAPAGSAIILPPSFSQRSRTFFFRRFRLTSSVVAISTSPLHCLVIASALRVTGEELSTLRLTAAHRLLSGHGRNGWPW